MSHAIIASMIRCRLAAMSLTLRPDAGQEATWRPQDAGRLIHFATMSDDDACWVAQQLWGMEQRGRGRG